MSWQAFQLTFRLESPLHSGYGKMGNIQRTRLYVTGRMLWGALTSTITRLKESPDYVKVGEMVKEYLRTSYLFPCLDQKGEQLILPRVLDNRSSYLVKGKDVNASMVERWLVTSYASTAIDTTKLAAEEGSLHEVELISHRFLCNSCENGMQINAGDPVYLSGVLFLADNAPDEIKNFLKPALNHLQVGGERSYGFGLLILPDEPRPTDSLFGYTLTLSAHDPEVTVNKGEPLPAHVIVEDDLDLQGVIEPFLGRETMNDGRFGKNLSKAEACWIPGTTTQESRTFCIKEKGLWQIKV